MAGQGGGQLPAEQKIFGNQSISKHGRTKWTIVYGTKDFCERSGIQLRLFSAPGSKLKKIGSAKLSIRLLHLNAVLWIRIRSLFPDPAKMKNNIHNYNFISLLIMCRKVRFICSSKGYKLVDMLKIQAIKVESGSGSETHLSRTGTGSGINHSGFTTPL